MSPLSTALVSRSCSQKRSLLSLFLFLFISLYIFLQSTDGLCPEPLSLDQLGKRCCCLSKARQSLAEWPVLPHRKHVPQLLTVCPGRLQIWHVWQYLARCPTLPQWKQVCEIVRWIISLALWGFISVGMPLAGWEFTCISSVGRIATEMCLICFGRSSILCLTSISLPVILLSTNPIVDNGLHFKVSNNCVAKSRKPAAVAKVSPVANTITWDGSLSHGAALSWLSLSWSSSCVYFHYQ